MIKILVIGKSGRLDSILEALYLSPRPKQLFVLSEVCNSGLSLKAKVRIGKTDNLDTVSRYACEVKPDFAIIGPEEPLFAGVVDKLAELGIPCVGPTKLLAQLEWSKSFTRNLVSKYGIPGNPRHKIFRSIEGIEPYLRELGDFVVKPDGLTGGKGVQVSGEHLKTIEQAVAYCQELFTANQPSVVIEEKLDGEEFSFQSFCDGIHVKDTIPIQDHKRAGEGDTGANTGGMGSYSCEDHSLPFLRREHIDEASRINRAVAKALLEECGAPFKGILYGGFMLTKNGLRLIEYNARFGDPEVMNVLPLLETDFIDVCEAIIKGNLDKLKISFRKKATVCKYVVPQGYPASTTKGVPIDSRDILPPSEQLRIYYAAVQQESDGPVYLTGSRALAFVGIGDTLAEAERIAESAASQVRGPVFHRRDIGTAKLIQKRVDHMNAVLAPKLEMKVQKTTQVAKNASGKNSKKSTSKTGSSTQENCFVSHF